MRHGSYAVGNSAEGSLWIQSNVQCFHNTYVLLDNKPSNGNLYCEIIYQKFMRCTETMARHMFHILMLAVLEEWRSSAQVEVKILANLPVRTISSLLHFAQPRIEPHLIQTKSDE